MGQGGRPGSDDLVASWESLKLPECVNINRKFRVLSPWVTNTGSFCLDCAPVCLEGWTFLELLLLIIFG